jgi:uncharacterized protein YeaO (DUF488 family)
LKLNGLEMKCFTKEVRNNFINDIDKVYNEFMTKYKNEIETIHEAEMINKFILYLEKKIE